ncbi:MULTISPECIES: efflux RND transporter periplasmic adaptor subunit [Halomonadaceae]|uniref:efflux RND transporter periplasmic adaptor subunit n=1 Tax=Halomonadaceae TaxID=28256 RepID=UPI001598EEE0|nr:MULTISPECIES: efflux RND transporter periplasmic adaptor subunit [Halomonas]QJQ96096.1 efflux RND transporter periplasmic adaptor subunit [Halomonas sp. PA5]
MSTTLKNARFPLLALATLGLLLTGCGNDEASPAQAGGPQQEAPARPAEVMEMARRDVDIDRSYGALLRSDNEVVLVARVSGTLEARHFEPGDEVARGDSLYTIEPALYQATVRQREADLQSAQAEESRARRDAERYARLLSQNSVSQQQHDQAQADLRVATASVAQARAALDSANLDFGYTDVTAPVSGIISLSEVNVGNVVNSGTELATITPLDPLEVRFQLPQRDAFELRQQLREEEASSIGVSLAFPGEAGALLRGELDFLASRVSQQTSTVQASAVFENSEGYFLPGQFVRVRLEGMKRFDVMAVPEIAVTQGLMGPQVFVLDENDVARARTVRLGDLAGPWQIVLEGLDNGDRVVVSDPAGIQAGTRIEARPFDGDAEALVEDVEERERQQAQQETESMEQTEEAMGAEAAPAGGAEAEGE